MKKNLMSFFTNLIFLDLGCLLPLRLLLMDKQLLLVFALTINFPASSPPKRALCWVLKQTRGGLSTAKDMRTRTWAK